jgi:trimethylamine---corrinoid protein Co-methyltransferase
VGGDTLTLATRDTVRIPPELIICVAAGGANLIHDVGYLDSAMTGSLGLVVLCDEIINWVKSYLQPMAINQETLALDLIEEVGCDGHFLSTDHTLRHVRDDWQPTLFDRRDYDRWHGDGAARLEERALEKARRIIDEHRAPRLPKAVREELEAVVERKAR